MIMVIDNYDSFTYNLVQLIGRFRNEIVVKRNDEIDVAGIRGLRPDRVLLSPGPGRPEDAGVTMSILRDLSGEIPILGVCLGHQAIGLAFGGKIVHAPSLMHGRISQINHRGDGIYAGVPNPFVATRYHSLVVAPESIPADLEVTAWTGDGVIMGLRHRRLSVEGVQFHPESILTEAGERLLTNWLGVKA